MVEAAASWMEDALRRLFTPGELKPEDLEELTEVCKTRHGLSTKPATPLSAAQLPVAGNEPLSSVSVLSITHHNGVNALAPEQKVSFGPQLTIVYGENGAGKSGYTRVLKAACRSRASKIFSAMFSKVARKRISDGLQADQRLWPWRK